MLKIIILFFSIVLLFSGCTETKSVNQIYSFKYNLIEPGNGIYAITDKNIEKVKTINNNFEMIHYKNNKITKIERYNKNGKLSDDFNVSAITEFEYNFDGNMKYLKQYDKEGNKSEDEVFGYWSVEYIYDEQNRVVMEIYRNKEAKFLEVPLDKSGNLAKINFLSPVLTYEYIENNIKIKAFDQNFNLLKEIYGDKPCLPFIDCGENE